MNRIKELLIVSLVGWSLGQTGFDWKISSDNLVDPDLNAVTFGSDRWVAVGQDGIIMSSPFGDEFNEVTSPTTKHLNGVAYGADTYVAVGQDGTVLYSADGDSWQVTNAGGDDLNAVAWSVGVFAAVGMNGACYWSVDGSTWTGTLSGVSGNLYDVHDYGYGLRAVGSSHRVYFSGDGMQWNLNYNDSSGLAFYTATDDGNYQWIFGAFNEYQRWFADAEYEATLPNTVRASAWTGHKLILGGPDGVYISEDGDAWLHQSVPGFGEVQDLHWHNGVLMAVGHGGRIARASCRDTTRWTAVETGLDKTIRGITSNGRVWVAVASTGYVLTSSDGIHWKTQKLPFTSTLYGVAWGKGRFVAVGALGIVHTSPDGFSWTQETSPTSEALLAVTYGDDEFMAVGGHGVVLTSPDGSAWTLDDSGTTNYLYGVCFNQLAYIAVGANGTIVRKTNSTWTTQNSGTSVTLRGVASYQTSYIAVGDNGTALQLTGSTWQPAFNVGTSADLSHVILWGSRHTMAVSEDGEVIDGTNGSLQRMARMPDINLHCLATDGHRFIAGGAHGKLLVSAPTGFDWWDEKTSPFAEQLKAGTWNGEYLVAVSPGAGVLFSKFDESWKSTALLPDLDLTDVIWDGTQFVAVGEDQVGTGNPPSNWTFQPFGQTITSQALAFNGTRYVVVGQSGEIIHSTDLSVWNTTSSGTSSTIRDVIWDGVRFAAVASNSLLTSTDGMTWNVTSTGLSSSLRAVASNTTTTVVVGGQEVIGTSTAGSAFETTFDGSISRQFIDVIWTGSMFVALRNDGKLFGSSFGYEWHDIGQAPDMEAEALVWRGQELVVLGGVNNEPRSGHAPAPIGHAWRPLSASVDRLNSLTWTGEAIYSVSGNKIRASHDGINWFAIDSGQSLNLLSFTADGSVLLGGGALGRIVRSGDGGETWTSHSIGVPKTVQDLMCAKEMFVACAASGTIVTSTDGMSWNERDSGITSTLFALAHNAEIMVAMGATGRLVTSTDGVDWTYQGQIGSNTWRDVLWTGSKFLAVGDNGAVAMSEDGLNWDVSSLPTTDRLQAVASLGFMHATCSENRIWTSTDGERWNATERTGTPVSMTASGQSFIVGYNNGHVALSRCGSGYVKPELTQQPVDQTVCEGFDASFSVAVLGDRPHGFKWYKDDQPLPSGIGESATLELDHVSPGDAGTYQCVVTNGTLTDYSDDAVLIVNDAAGVTVNPHIYVQGLDNLVLSADIGCVAGPAITWFDLDGQSTLGNGNPLALPFMLTQTTAIEVEVVDGGDTFTDQGLVLVGQDQRFLDLNGDGCNSVDDLFHLVEEWRTQADDADGDSLITVLDFLYVNTDDPEPCP